MAVYTKITLPEMVEILSHYYDLNEYELAEMQPISDGISNTNYVITVKRKHTTSCSGNTTSG